MGKETVADEARRLGAAVAVVDPDEGGGRGGDHLALVLQGVVGLDDCDGELAGGVGLKVHVPHQPIAAAEPTEAPLQRPHARSQHHRRRRRISRSPKVRSSSSPRSLVAPMIKRSGSFLRELGLWTAILEHGESGKRRKKGRKRNRGI